MRGDTTSCRVPNTEADCVTADSHGSCAEPPTNCKFAVPSSLFLHHAPPADPDFRIGVFTPAEVARGGVAQYFLQHARPSTYNKHYSTITAALAAANLQGLLLAAARNSVSGALMYDHVESTTRLFYHTYIHPLCNKQLGCGGLVCEQPRCCSTGRCTTTFTLAPCSLPTWLQHR